MALIKNGRVALISFLIGVGLSFYVNFLSLFMIFTNQLCWLFIVFYVGISNVVIYFVYKMYYDVAVRSLHLGLGFSLSVFLVCSNLSYRLLGWYLLILCIFHFGEYLVTAITNPRNLSLESFLLDHSREYHIAITASAIEFFIEYFFFPSLKTPSLLNVIGLFIVICGDVLRKLAMLTAKTNFNHYVQHLKQEGHQLVTDGIYGFCRHPSYVGWFYWSIGTQLMLANPLCTLAYAYVSWRFFQERIVVEEIALINFFGEDYLEYQKNVGTGLPFIKGYRVEL